MLKSKRKVCPVCGTPLNDYELEFVPMDAGDWKAKIEAEIGESVTVSVEEGKSMRITIHNDLTTEQKTKLEALIKESNYKEKRREIEEKSLSG